MRRRPSTSDERASAATSVIVPISSSRLAPRFSTDRAHSVTSRIPRSAHQSMSSRAFSAPRRWPTRWSAKSFADRPAAVAVHDQGHVAGPRPLNDFRPKAIRVEGVDGLERKTHQPAARPRQRQGGCRGEVHGAPPRAEASTAGMGGTAVSIGAGDAGWLMRVLRRRRATGRRDAEGAPDVHARLTGSTWLAGRARHGARHPRNSPPGPSAR